MENNEYSYFTSSEINEMDDSDRINNVFTQSEIEELDNEFDSYLIELGYTDFKCKRYIFKSTGRVIYVDLKSGICEIIKLSDGFSNPKPYQVFDEIELSELNSEFNGMSIIIDFSALVGGFSTFTFSKGKVIWYNILETHVEVSNIIKPANVAVTVSKSTGMKFDDGKLLCMAMPAVEYKQILEVLTSGAKKYKIDNWKHVDNARTRYMNGLERHFLDYKEAIQTGNEELKFDNGEGGMGTHHLANLICNAIFLMYFDNNKID